MPYPCEFKRNIWVSSVVAPTVLAENEPPSEMQKRYTSASAAFEKVPQMAVTAPAPTSCDVPGSSPASPTSDAANAPGAQARAIATMDAKAAVLVKRCVTGSFPAARRES
jgi:hypothetical protein